MYVDSLPRDIQVATHLFVTICSLHSHSDYIVELLPAWYAVSIYITCRLECILFTKMPSILAGGAIWEWDFTNLQSRMYCIMLGNSLFVAVYCTVCLINTGVITVKT
ncbi:hypothetical protein EB796_017865 [Bugula neritina]|uniref:Uncharacterized protein n=1 Tax=Bugula neritina TaxID=10212 RepID=A0A7J7JCT2_BUGNE|nr:hypothetical protein EB796_017865 [Bugula neritina]